MQGLLLFVLPAGYSAEVTRPAAQSICDRLWEQGIEPGAATAATRITEGLQGNPLFGNDLHFDDRELTPLLVACENAISDLTAQREDHNASPLIGDLQELREELRAIESSGTPCYGAGDS